MSAEGVRRGQHQLGWLCLPVLGGSSPATRVLERRCAACKKPCKVPCSTGSLLDPWCINPAQSKHTYTIKGRFFGSWATCLPKTPPLLSDLSTFELVPDAIEINDQFVVSLSRFWISPHSPPPFCQADVSKHGFSTLNLIKTKPAPTGLCNKSCWGNCWHSA